MCTVGFLPYIYESILYDKLHVQYSRVLHCTCMCKGGCNKQEACLCVRGIWVQRPLAAYGTYIHH